MDYVVATRTRPPYLESGTTMDLYTTAWVGLTEIQRAGEKGDIKLEDCFRTGLVLLLKIPCLPQSQLEMHLQGRFSVSDVGFLAWYLKCAKIVPSKLATWWVKMVDGNPTMFSNEGEFLKQLISSPYPSDARLERPFWSAALEAFPGLLKWIHYSRKRAPVLDEFTSNLKSYISNSRSSLTHLLVCIKDMHVRDEAVEKDVIDMCTQETMISEVMSVSPNGEFGGMWEECTTNATFMISHLLHLCEEGERVSVWKSLMSRALMANSTFAIEALLSLCHELTEGRKAERDDLIAMSILQWKKLKMLVLEPMYMMMHLAGVSPPVTKYKALRQLAPTLPIVSANIATIVQDYSLPPLNSYMWTEAQLSLRYASPLRLPLECPMTIVNHMTALYNGRPPVVTMVKNEKIMLDISFATLNNITHVVVISDARTPIAKAVARNYITYLKVNIGLTSKKRSAVPNLSGSAGLQLVPREARFRSDPIATIVLQENDDVACMYWTALHLYTCKIKNISEYFK